MVLLATKFVLLALVLRSHRALTCEAPQLDALHIQHFGDVISNMPMWVLNRTCVQDESLIVYDSPPPNIDVSMMRYTQVKPVKPAPGHPGTALPPPLPDGVLVQRVDLKYNLPIRAASQQERSSPPAFSNCTLPVIIFSDWPHNLGEFLIRPPAAVHYAQQHGWLDRNATLVLATPERLPLEPFNWEFMQPFTRYAVTSLWNFSAYVPLGSPSGATAEGVAVRCYERLVVARVQGGSFPEGARAARAIGEHYLQRGLPQVDLWRSSGPGVLRILLETRPGTRTRQWLQLHALLEECNAARPVERGPQRAPTTLECRAYSFGQRGVAADVAVMRQADVLVAFHGAGENNVHFMPLHSSVIEVRPREFGTTHQGWPNIWQPQVARQSGWPFFWWCLNVEDPQLSLPSALELAGLDFAANAARDRNVLLRWRDVRPIVEAVAKVDRDKGAYLATVMAYKFYWQVDPGGVLVQAPQHARAVYPILP